jgi:hypothetical protein
MLFSSVFSRWKSLCEPPGQDRLSRRRIRNESQQRAGFLYVRRIWVDSHEGSGSAGSEHTLQLPLDSAHPGRKIRRRFAAQVDAPGPKRSICGQSNGGPTAAPKGNPILTVADPPPIALSGRAAGRLRIAGEPVNAITACPGAEFESTRRPDKFAAGPENTGVGKKSHNSPERVQASGPRLLARPTQFVPKPIRAGLNFELMLLNIIDIAFD